MVKLQWHILLVALLDPAIIFACVPWSIWKCVWVCKCLIIAPSFPSFHLLSVCQKVVVVVVAEAHHLCDTLLTDCSSSCCTAGCASTVAWNPQCSGGADTQPPSSPPTFSLLPRHWQHPSFTLCVSARCQAAPLPALSLAVTYTVTCSLLSCMARLLSASAYSIRLLRSPTLLVCHTFSLVWCAHMFSSVPASLQRWLYSPLSSVASIQFCIATTNRCSFKFLVLEMFYYLRRACKSSMM